MSGSQGNEIMGRMGGPLPDILDKTGNETLPGGGTTDQMRKAYYDPVGLFGGGGDVLWSKAGMTGKAKTPGVVRSDPKGDADKAAAEATAYANSQARNARRLSRSSSLMAAGNRGDTSGADTASSISYGKSSLGG